MIIGCETQIPIGKVFQSDITDYDGVRHIGVPIMVLRQATFTEWVNELKAHGTWKAKFISQEPFYFYQISID